MEKMEYKLEQLQDDDFYDSVCIDTYVFREDEKGNTYYLDMLNNKQFAICKNEYVIAVFPCVEPAIDYFHNL